MTSSTPDARTAEIALVRGANRVAGHLSLIEETSDNGDSHFELVCDVEGQRFRGDGSDVAAALDALRSRLESGGLLIQVAGAEHDVVVSPMSRQMGQGRRGYRVRPGHPADHHAMVDVLAPAHHGVTRAEQADATNRWQRSLAPAGRIAAAFRRRSG